MLSKVFQIPSYFAEVILATTLSNAWSENGMSKVKVDKRQSSLIVRSLPSNKMMNVLLKVQLIGLVICTKQSLQNNYEDMCSSMFKSEE